MRLSRGQGGCLERWRTERSRMRELRAILAAGVRARVPMPMRALRARGREGTTFALVLMRARSVLRTQVH
jgi:hypothetical protein